MLDQVVRTFRNRLLGAIPSDELAFLTPHLEAYAPELKERLYEAGKPIEHVYFVESGVISMVTYTQGGVAILEVATIGNEGMVGLPLFLGIDESPLETFAQIRGQTWRIAAAPFLEALEKMPTLQKMLRRYTQAMFVQIARNAACNGTHTIEQRAARWLLMSHDRMDGGEFVLTHEFLGQMLGVRRAGVTVVMGELQRRGLLSYTRGNVTILDREGLEDIACECYGIIREEYTRLVG